MRIEEINIAAINPAAYNPRKELVPGSPEWAALERSLERWDAVEPLVWNERTKNLVGGHQRLRILQARGDVTVVVSVVDLDDAEERALNLALNKTGSTWDERKLFDLLTDLPAESFALSGFSRDELDGLSQAMAQEELPLFVPVAEAEIHVSDVTQADIERAAEGLQQKVERTNADKIKTAVCPQCGHSFGILDAYQKR